MGGEGSPTHWEGISTRWRLLANHWQMVYTKYQAGARMKNEERTLGE
jgi:hypothetical protein